MQMITNRPVYSLYVLASSNELYNLLLQHPRMRDMEIVHLQNEDEALYRLLHHGSHTVVLVADATDPEIHTFDILKKIQTGPDCKISSIIVAPTGEPVDIDRVLSYGAEDYIIKDQFSAEELVTKIQRVRMRMDSLFIPMHNTINPNNSQIDITAITVLIIEDDQFLRDLAERKLKQEGFQVDIALDGNEGLKKIEKTKPDVVLLDIILPGIDGFDILKKVRSHSDTDVQKIVVILLSNLGQEADVAKGERLGADDYLIKANFTIDEIIEKIKSAIASKRGRQIV